MEMRNQDLDAAISALSSSIEAMYKRMERIDDNIQSIKNKRQTYLESAVATLLPSISQSVLRTLRSEVPRFVTPVVEDAFKDNKKFLGLFAGAGYQQALALLRTRLASHLDEIKYGDLGNNEMLNAVEALSKEKATISTAKKDTLELLKVMEKARQKKVDLPVGVREHVHTIARTMRTGKAEGYRPRAQHTAMSGNSFTSSSSSYIEPVDDHFDLLFYMATQVPISARTLIFDAIIEDDTRRQSVSSPAYSDPTDYSGRNDSPDNSSFDATPGQTFDAGPGVGAVGAAAAVVGGAAVVVGGDALFGDAIDSAFGDGDQGSTILTDDSLGAFS